MARTSPPFTALNRGEVSTLVLGRTDIEHLRLAAQIQANWQPRVLGPMTFRPGSAYVDPTYNGQPAKMLSFVAQFSDTAIIELTDSVMRVLVDDAPVTRVGVSTFVPAFNQSGWYTVRQTGTAQLQYGGTAVGLTIWGMNIGASVAVDCQLSIPSQDIGVEHSLRIVVGNGPILFRVGSSQGAQDLFITATLDTGTYSLAFTPLSGTAYIEFASTIGPENYSTLRNTQPQGIQQVYVQSIALEPGGVMILPTPWLASVVTAPSVIKYTPSADVTFVACPNVAQQVITRYGVTSWGIGLYKPVKGPMNATPGSSSVILSIGADIGNTTMTSNQPQFSPADVGTLFRLYHWSQYLTQTISFDGTWTDAIRVTGVSTISLVVGGMLSDISVADRQFNFSISGTWSGTVTLQRSFASATSDFEDYQNYTTNQGNTVVDDGLNNNIVYYRLGVHPGNLASGNPICTFGYGGGGGEGVVHVTQYISAQEVIIEVLVACVSSGAAYDWRQSQWSTSQGYPTSTAIHEGRLWWAGSERWWGSTSDDYTNFDFDLIGDAQYIDVDVGQGPIANINWLVSLDALIGGGDTQVIMARSDAIQDPLTPTNFNLRFSTNQGASPVQAGKLDRTAIFINQSGRRVYKLEYDLYMYNMKATELSNLNPDIGGYIDPPGGYVAMAVQRNPDTIIHLVRADGQMVCLLYDPDDDVKAFWRKTTEGTYEDVIVQPGVIEDTVYVVVKRQNGRFIEQFARLDECWGDTICKLVDSHAIYQGVATKTISSPWLANQQVAVWADGVDMALVTNPATGQPTGLIQLDGNGNGTLPTTALNIIWGLPYQATFLSAKLAYGAQMGSAINEWKRLDHIGFVLQNTHCQGITYGAFPVNPIRNAGGDFSPDFSSDFSGAQNLFWDTASPMDPMPQVEYGVTVPSATVWAFYDRMKIEFSGNADPDARLCIQAYSPRPATVVAVTFAMETTDG